MNLMIVSGMFVCSSFLISVCMFIVLKALLISSATVTNFIILKSLGTEFQVVDTPQFNNRLFI